VQIELQAKLLNYFLGSNKSNINQLRNRYGDNNQISNRYFIYYQKSKGRREKDETHGQVQRSDFRDSAKVKRLRQLAAEMVQARDSKATI